MSTRYSAPFDIIDYNKCEKLNSSLQESGLSMRDILYHSTAGRNIEVSGKKNTRDSQVHQIIFSESRERKPASCHIQGSDAKLQADLYDKGKLGMLEATAFAIWLEKNRVDWTDIPVNLASCNGPKGTRTGQVSLKELPTGCQLERIDAHNTDDVNAAFHLHITCTDTSEQTLSFLRKVVQNANSVGSEMCRVTKPRTKIETSRARRLARCLEDCTRTKTRQTRLGAVMY